MWTRSQESLKNKHCGFIAFTLFPAVTKTTDVPTGRTDALWANTNDSSLEFHNLIEEMKHHNIIYLIHYVY